MFRVDTAKYQNLLRLPVATVHIPQPVYRPVRIPVLPFRLITINLLPANIKPSVYAPGTAFDTKMNTIKRTRNKGAKSP